MINSLQYHGAINWWNYDQFPKLVAIKTESDGNCLLHSVAFSLTGQNDALQLRKDFHDFFSTNPIVEEIKVRWMNNLLNTAKAENYEISANQIDSEWNQLIDNTSTAISNGGMYRSLEAIHIYGLAQMLKKVIIVFSGKMLLDLDGIPFVPIDIGGIYVPNLVATTQIEDPILIGYDEGHFTTLKVAENIISSYHIPITNKHSIHMEHRFSSPLDSCSIFGKYLNLAEKENIHCFITKQVVKVTLNDEESPKESSEFDNYNFLT